ncbi:MAG: hypothetical protein WC461_02480 [Candidatus Paceibacterota bacterium]
MINAYEKELIAAFFQGGNAKEKTLSDIRGILEIIKEAVTESKSEQQTAHVFHPDRPNPAR